MVIMRVRAKKMKPKIESCLLSFFSFLSCIASFVILLSSSARYLSCHCVPPTLVSTKCFNSCIGRFVSSSSVTLFVPLMLLSYSQNDQVEPTRATNKSGKATRLIRVGSNLLFAILISIKRRTYV